MLYCQLLAFSYQDAEVAWITMLLKQRTHRFDGVLIPSVVCKLLACLPATNTYVTDFMGDARSRGMKCWFTSQ